MKRRLVVRGAILGALGLLACGPILGLDDLKARSTADDGGTSAADAANDTLDARANCTSNAQCFVPGEPFVSICANRQCVKVNREYCLSEVYPNREMLENDNVLFITALLPFPKEGETASVLQGPLALAYVLAVREIEKAGGLYIDAKTRRQVALQVCDSDRAKLGGTINHVVNELRAPAIIANIDQADLLTNLQTTAKQSTFVLNPNASTIALKFQITADQLVWSLLGTPADIAVGYPPLIRRLEKIVVGDDAGLNVALVHSGDDTEATMATVLLEGPLRDGLSSGREPSLALRYNGGRSVADNADAGHFNTIAVKNFTGAVDETDIANAVDKLVDAGPKVVILLASDQSTAIMLRYEDRLTDAGATDRPFWILGPRNSTAPVPIIGDGGGQPVADRMAGIQFAGPENSPTQEAYRARARFAYGDDKAADLYPVENHYDAVYWIAYGSLAGGRGQEIRGSDIASGVRRLLKGPVVSPGPADTIQAAGSTISVTEDVTYVGALGVPDINPRWGTWNSVGALYCFDVNGAPPNAKTTLRYDVLRYPSDGGAVSSGCKASGP